MRPSRVRFSRPRSEVVIFDKGLNENVTSLQLGPGELSRSYNYELVEGNYGGYRSVEGFERYDGQTKPSSIPVINEEDTDRENARAAITEVPGQGTINGVHIFQNEVYAFRDKTGGATAGMYKATSSGWVEIDTSANPLNPGGSYEFVNYNFLGTTGGFSMYWANGVDKARKFDGTTVSLVDNSGMDPSDTPEHIDAHNNRLFLTYAGGSLQYSSLGDPLDWTTNAGEIGIGKDITAIQSSVGNLLIVYCNESIKFLQGSTPNDWVLQTFSKRSGAYAGTVQRLLGTSFFMDDRGVTTLAAVQEYGDLAANSISQNIKRTLLAKRENVTASIVSRNKNQYRLFFNDGSSFSFSFNNKKLRGITQTILTRPVFHITEGTDSDGTNVIFFSSNTGYVYQMDIGTSFDGDEIETFMMTTFYHYKSPRNWKRFLRVTTEIVSEEEITINFKPSFDYTESITPKALDEDFNVKGLGSRWGIGVWGTMIWGGTEATSRYYIDLLGLGSNMSTAFSTLSKYNGPHTIQNMIVEFSLCGRQL